MLFKRRSAASSVAIGESARSASTSDAHGAVVSVISPILCHLIGTFNRRHKEFVGTTEDLRCSIELGGSEKGTRNGSTVRCASVFRLQPNHYERRGRRSDRAAAARCANRSEARDRSRRDDG